MVLFHTLNMMTFDGSGFDLGREVLTDYSRYYVLVKYLKIICVLVPAMSSNIRPSANSLEEIWKFERERLNYNDVSR